jgi:methylphosphotriester-DNA--protein-cysteine methyltransferase
MPQDILLLSQRVNALLSNNPKLTLKALARSIGIDRHKIEHAIRKQYSLSFRDLKKRTQLKRVLKLLEEHPNSYIKEIASEVGFTPNHLSRFIRSLTGRCATEIQRHK